MEQVLTYRTLSFPVEGLYKDRKSTFYSYAYPVSSEEEINDYVKSCRAEHHAARHWCYAWILDPDGGRMRANDDGEPSGSAGKPILNAIRALNITNVLVIVVRYFGGIKLGVPGLIAAYRGATEVAFEQAEFVEITVCARYRLGFGYSVHHDVMGIIKDTEGTVLMEQYTDGCSMHVEWSLESLEIAQEKLEDLVDVFEEIDDLEC